MDILAGLESGKYRLGKLCPKSHEWESTGMSVRYKSNNACCTCSKNPPKRIVSEAKRAERKEKDKLKYASDPVYKQQKIEASRLARIRHKDEINRRQRESYKSDPDRYLKSRVDYNNRNRDLINQKSREYNKIHSKQKMENNRARRAKVRQNHHAPYSACDLAEKMAVLGDCCLYCQSKDFLTIDHIIPIAKGGSDCLGNIVYACKRCNSSKCDSDVIKWFKKQRQCNNN